MVKIAFTLQDAPDFWQEVETDCQLLNSDEPYTVREETAIAFLLKSHFPQIYKSKRRIKNLIVKNDKGNIYTTDDFDIYGSLKKEE